MRLWRGGEQQDAKVNEAEETLHADRAAQGGEPSMAGPHDNLTDEEILERKDGVHPVRWAAECNSQEAERQRGINIQPGHSKWEVVQRQLV